MPPRLHRLPVFSSRAFPHPHPRSSCGRPFSSTAPSPAEAHSPSFYEILNVPATASTAEIKKQFYALSLAHHPDRNPKDPAAHAKFTSISSAYHVLSHASRRARYDRDNHIHTPVQAPNTDSHHHRKASYVGSRPPSGLRKERGPFHGPPPSFYSHGGYGTGQHARHKHASNAASASQSNNTTTSSSSESESSFIFNNPVFHFDAQSHFRTQSHEDERRRLRRHRAMEREKARMREEGGLTSEDSEGSMSTRFFAILTIVGLGALAASLGRTFGPQQPTPPSARGRSVAKH
ncbi:curved DNA-binding protein [Blastomyces parvus]|uniref:Curved DNA-binding protein n=1 Tax=Blastomyces parvus TaxID=2060905 RepID=A0A2B7WIB4_9EURO|nr:curved DNA-binding protein [Blastomyces parvus]